MATNSVNKIVCSGGLFLARNTKRFLFLARAQTKTAGSWGLVGGKKDPSDITPLDTLTREILEEVGKTPTIKKVIPLESFTSSDQYFQYSTYVLIIDREFIPVLNSEHTGYAWCEFDDWPRPLHYGVRSSLSNRTIKSKLQLILELI